MHVILLATHEHNKLQPMAEALPAPLVPVVNRPVMAHTIELLARSGIKQLAVSLYNQGGRIVSTFGNGRHWGVEIEYIIQREALGSAGALRWAAPRFQSTVLVLPADRIIDLDLPALLEQHQARQSAMTLVLHPTCTNGAELVAIAADGRVQGSMGSEDTSAAFTGAMLIEPQLLEYIPARVPFDCYEQFIPALLRAGVPVDSYTMQGYWNPLETSEQYHEAQRVFLYSAWRQAGLAEAPAPPALPQVRYATIAGRQIAPGIWAGRHHSIQPGARLTAPICIGDGCQVGRNAEVGPEVVLGPHVVLDDEVTVERSTILGQTYVGRLANIQGRIVDQTRIINVQTAEYIDIVDAFLLSSIELPAVRPRFRRLFSICVALLLMLLLSPLLALIALILLFTNRGRVLQPEQRIGRRATFSSSIQKAPESFQMLSFCTQRPDGTVSTVGAWLHRREWDHLPALWNVLCGDIDLVGVKPLLPQEAAQLREAWHQKRFDRPAGLTGEWFIQTNRGSELDDILVADVYSVAIDSWRNDMRIVWHTPGAWVRRTRNPAPIRQEAAQTERWPAW